MKLISAKLQARNKVVLRFDGSPEHLLPERITFSPPKRILAIEQLEDTCVVLTDDFNLAFNHVILIRDAGYLPVIPDEVFQEFVSGKRPGCSIESGRRVLRLYAPRATSVRARVYPTLTDEIGTLYDMQRDENGMWELAIEINERDRYYCYHVNGPRESGDVFDERVPVADPYARLVVTRNSYRHQARAVLSDDHPFDWEGDAPIVIHPRDLVIYEMHVRDMTVHVSSGVDRKIAGTYLGMTQTGAAGGLDHLKRLGVNAVEIMPVQHFASLEPPYQHATPEGFFNTWNPYARNHWGYMTSYFFAPEPTLATGPSREPGAWNDTQGRQSVEFKRMVKALHEEGIAVIMDVVYNHTSQYDDQPLKFIDRKYYYHLGARGEPTGHSGCGNDFHTERPMARRLIVDSIVHWMTEYHIDGFRFDLATMIDPGTWHAVVEAARAVNPGVILIAEPWGGGQYDLARFSRIGVSAWNDIFRDGVRGYNPNNAHGFLFGTWGSHSSEDYGKWVLGCTLEKGGPFLDAAHSVNYLSAHDGHTLGDFIRIACGRISGHAEVLDTDAYVRLTEREMRIAKLAALVLLTSQGVVMIEQGQEFARPKVIADRGLPGTTPRMIDHNSYEKDDETNWMNYDHAAVNGELVDYYHGLIAIRKRFPLLRHAPHAAYRFQSADIPIASGFVIRGEEGGSPVLAVLVNANAERSATYRLPAGHWTLLADGRKASPSSRKSLNHTEIIVPPSTGMILHRTAD